jgi:hypothetical protein
MDPCVIVIFATRSMLGFAENAIRGIARCGIDPSIVQFVIPEKSRKIFDERFAPYPCRIRCIEDILHDEIDLDSEEYHNWGTRQFNRLMRVRLPVVSRILAEHNCPVIHADADVAWLRNPIPYISGVLSVYPWTSQTEATAHFPPPFCMGFFAARPDPFCFDLMEQHAERLALAETDVNVTMQTLFQQMVAENPATLSRIFPLPEGLFPCGLLNPLFLGGATKVRMVDQLQPFIFHANWTIGSENKQDLLRETRLWDVRGELKRDRGWSGRRLMSKFLKNSGREPYTE